MKTLFAVAYVAGIAWLGAWELAALCINTRYTLSDMTWQWEGTGWTAARYATVVSLSWLTVHLAFRWLR